MSHLPTHRRGRPANGRPLVVDDPAHVAEIRRRLPSFQEFVEDALFHPQWGYYATGTVQFGDGGHYETYPIALSPLFGRMVAELCFRRWRQWHRPARFELCEIGAGNGQLCQDALTWIEARSRRHPTWKEFTTAFRYRIIEKSSALRRRQAALLGPLQGRVVWDSVDLAVARRLRPRGTHAVVVANEVLDCLPHHRIVVRPNGTTWVTYVGGYDIPGRSSPSPALLSRTALYRSLRRAPPGYGNTFRPAELLLPVEALPGLRNFLRRHDIGAPANGDVWVYFAAPEIERFVGNLGRLYSRSEALLIDYGGDRSFHRREPPELRMRVGRPQDGASPYRAPGRDDITFLVDFSVAMTAARAQGLRVAYYGSQAELARRSGVVLDASAIEQIVQHRSLTWLLALAGVGPDRAQKSTALTWTAPPDRPDARTLRHDARAAVKEFSGGNKLFKLLILQRTPGHASGK